MSIPIDMTLAEQMERLLKDNARPTARVEELEDALEPFANAANRYDPVEKDDEVTAWDWAPTIGMLRIARAAITKGESRE